MNSARHEQAASKELTASVVPAVSEPAAKEEPAASVNPVILEPAAIMEEPAAGVKESTLDRLVISESTA